jgi:Na+-transporting methylmalonyl-CoA/oxaloacetate decarboxylase gamma subunit
MAQYGSSRGLGIFVVVLLILILSLQVVSRLGQKVAANQQQACISSSFFLPCLT